MEIKEELRTWFEKETKKPSTEDEVPTKEYVEWVEKKFEEVRYALKKSNEIITLNF